MESKLDNKGDKLDFYTKLRKEYEKSPKPFTYEFSFSEQPKHKKFRILLGRFVQILKEGMKDEYRFEEGNIYSYWNEFQKKFRQMDEMSYIINKVYEVAEKKIRIFFALLIQTRRLFEVLYFIVNDLAYLYVDGEMKKKGFEADVSQLKFLKDGQIEVESIYVKEFQAYLVEIREQQLALKMTVNEVLRSIVDQVEKEIQEERLRAEMMEKIRQEQLEKQRLKELKEKQALLQKMKPVEKVEPKPKPKTNPSIGNPPQQLITPAPVEPTPELSLKRKPRHLKNSDHLFNEKFSDQLEVFFYAGRPQPSANKSNCFECRQPLSEGLYIFGSNMNYCNYLGEWYCNDHTAEERIQIPYKAREEFDLRGYNVSKSGLERIKRYYEKAIIQIGYEDAVVKRSKKLYEFLILRRQIHLMYDSICNSELMDNMLKNKVNYCLQQNLFSLKNLYDIYNGHEGTYLEGEFQILYKHFYRCETCLDRKGRLCAVCNHPPKIYAFELRETYSCERCRKISHRRCLEGNKCPCE